MDHVNTSLELIHRTCSFSNLRTTIKPRSHQEESVHQ